MPCSRPTHKKGWAGRSTWQLQQATGQTNPLLLWFWSNHFSNIQHVYLQSSVEPDSWRVRTTKGTDTDNMKVEMSNTLVSHQMPLGLSRELVFLEKAVFKLLQSNQGNCYQSPHIRGFYLWQALGKLMMHCSAVTSKISDL